MLVMSNFNLQFQTIAAYYTVLTTSLLLITIFPQLVAVLGATLKKFPKF